MRPIWFDGRKDMQCLNNHIKSTNWTLNLNYWVGGSREENCTWKWCSTDGVLKNTSGDLMWASGQPDNLNGSEACLHLRIFNNGSDVALSDRKCTDKYVMACRVSIGYAYILTYFKFWIEFDRAASASSV
jgi:hypothetical protein